ncbi:MAG: hypothetical protein CMP59_04755 [Flavobacteriales bacterium]|nr:hypothetical protein [Flavobacteriales bacterium]
MELINEEPNYNYGGFWIRFVAYLIDSIVLYFAFAILTFAFTGDLFYQSKIDPTAFGKDYWLLTSSNFILSLLYFVGMESSRFQATLGKQVMGLKVINSEGGRLSQANALGRYLGKIVSALILLIGYIMAGFDAKKQALHDKIAGTYVIQESRT